MNRRNFMKAVAVGVCAELIPLNRATPGHYKTYPAFFWHEAEVVCRQELVEDYLREQGTVCPNSVLLPMPDGESITMPPGSMAIQGVAARKRADGQYLLSVSFGRCPDELACLYERTADHGLWKLAKWAKPRG